MLEKYGMDAGLDPEKARAALAYIALSEGRRETRERLVGLLWSESGEDKARASLRQTLRDLRVAEVIEQDLTVDGDGAVTFRTKVRLSFKYEGNQ